MTNGTEEMKRQASELIEQAYQRGYNVGYEVAKENIKSDTESRVAELMEIGRNEAWEAAEKIAGDCLCGSEITKELFDFSYAYGVFRNFSASEAIEKLRSYEEKQKKQEENSEIHVGDVIRNDDVEVVVTWCDGKNCNGFLLKRKDENVGEVGQVYSCMSCNCWEKTGRTFPEIAEVLKKMKEKIDE